MEKNFEVPSNNCESSLSNEDSNIVDKPEDGIHQIREDEFDSEYDCNGPNGSANSSKGDNNTNKNSIDDIV